MKPAVLICLAILAGCSSGRTPQIAAPQAAPARPIDWRGIATGHDRARLRQWRSAWVRALAKAQAAGHGAAIAREGALLQPDAAIALEPPPPGRYRCRTIKIGGQSPGLLDYVAYPYFSCRIRSENGVLGFAKLSGSQRPIGLILPDTSRRMIFLGTLQLGDERGAMQYGRDRERDLIAAVERVAPQRWRMVFPLPHFESTLDILELVPIDKEPSP